MSGDSIDRVIEEWEAEHGRFVLHREGECSFVKYTARDFLVVAAWRRAGPEAALLGYLTPESDHGFQYREADVSELRAALGLPAWVAPPAPTQALLERAEQAEAQRDAARLRVGELEREAGRGEMELEQVRRRSRSNAHALNAARVLVAEALRMMDAREELDEAKGRFARAHAAYREAEEVCDDEQP